MSVPDKNYMSYANDKDVGDHVLQLLEPPPEYGEWNDTLKFSNAKHGTFHVMGIQGGKEDCVDFNNGCDYLRVHVAELQSGGQYVATIKGGCTDLWLSGKIYKHGSVVDVDIDNYSDQSHRASSMIKLNLTTHDGSPVTWRSLKGCKPIFCNADLQEYRCKLYLPWVVGVIWDRFYQLLKLVRIAA